MTIIVVKKKKKTIFQLRLLSLRERRALNTTIYF